MSKPNNKEEAYGKRLAKCCVCSRITKEWVVYGSAILAEEYPSECIYVCSGVCSGSCFDAAVKKIESGEWKTPILKKALGGSAHDISSMRIGYEKQPPQDELIDILLLSRSEN